MLSILSTYMKLYSLLIWTKNTKKSKNNFKAPKKSEIVIFPDRILTCKQNKSTIYSTSHHTFPRLGRGDQSNAANWCLFGVVMQPKLFFGLTLDRLFKFFLMDYNLSGVLWSISAGYQENNPWAFWEKWQNPRSKLKFQGQVYIFFK